LAQMMCLELHPLMPVRLARYPPLPLFPKKQQELNREQ